MTLSPDTGSDLAVVNLVRTDGGAESLHQLADELSAGELIVNLRAEGDPSHLEITATTALSDVARLMGVTPRIEHCESFRPGRPEPTHRMATP
jgi:hypothetical protein